MSRPKGKAIQREMGALIKSILEPWGCICTMDFSKRGGHQRMLVAFPNGQPNATLQIPSTPRDGHNALEMMKQRCERLIRERFG